MNTTQDIDLRTKAKLSEVLFGDAPLSLSAMFIIAILVFVILREYMNHEYISYWLGGMLFVTVARAVITSLHWKKKKASPESQPWKYTYLLLLYLTAALWGVLIYIPQTSIATWLPSFIAFVIAGVSAGALLTLSSMLTASVPYLTIMILPFSISFAVDGSLSHLIMAMLLVFYLISLIRISFKINRMLVKAIHTELESDDMLVLLKKVKKNAENKFRQYKEEINKFDITLQMRNAYFEHTHEMICIIDSDGEIKQINPSLLEFIGLEYIDAIGKSFFDYVLTEDLQELNDKIKSAFIDDMNFRVLVHIRMANGNYQQCQFTATFAGGLYYCYLHNLDETSLP